MKAFLILLIGIGVCVALLVKAGRITNHGWDLNPYPHYKLTSQLRKDRLTLYSLQLDAIQQRQDGNLHAAEQDYKTIISGPATLHNMNDYVIIDYIRRSQISLAKVKQEECHIEEYSSKKGIVKKAAKVDPWAVQAHR